MASLEEIRSARLEKLRILEENGKNPYPISVRRDRTLQEAVEHFEEFSTSGEVFSLVGRVISLRPQGGLIFLHFTDGTGKFQALLKKSEGITDADFDLFVNTVDIGDFISVRGTLFKTKRDEMTIQVTTWDMISKSLRPLPEKYHGLQDVEERYRRRYLDVISSEEVRDRFIVRAKIVSGIRRYLDMHDFLEVETPILQPLAGGATAEPFETHHNALDINMFLRIAPELYLKELLVAGYPKVYELGRLFRNEGIDLTHNPEFTTVEFYEAYAEAKDHRVLVEDIIRTLVSTIFGKMDIINDEGIIHFGNPFEVITYENLIEKYAGIKNIFAMDRTAVAKVADSAGIAVAPSDPWEKIIDNIYKKLCRPQLIQPTFIIDYPVEFSPLAKNKEDNPKMIDRFQLVIAGFEVLNAFSELNNPLEQAKRFEAQQANKEAGDKEASPNDMEYLEAMEYGMPPAGGVGLSIDRLAMIFTNTRNIREVILFPTLKPR